MIDPSSSEEEDDDRGHKSKHGHKGAGKASGGAVANQSHAIPAGGSSHQSSSSHHSTPDKVNQGANNLRHPSESFGAAKSVVDPNTQGTLNRLVTKYINEVNVKHNTDDAVVFLLKNLSDQKHFIARAISHKCNITC